MLSESCFQSEFLEFLCPHFGKEIASPRLIDAYYQSFQRYSDQTFTMLCGMAFRECRFMPEPQWFSDRAEDLAERALIEADHHIALPSAQMRELDNMTEEQRIANVQRLRAMTRNTFPFRLIRGGRRA